MEAVLNKALEDYAHDHTQPEPEYLRQLEERTFAEIDRPGMISGRSSGRLMKMLVQLARPKLIVEVGTFTGYSALWMAEGLPEGGRIITCEVDPKAQKIAQEAIDASPHRGKIEIRMGPALETLRAIDEPIDFSFIDADKEAYPDYYEEIVSRTRSGGVILLDNMFKAGRVLDPENAEGQAGIDARVVHKLNAAITQDERVENLLLTVRDGIQFVMKK
jgi:caffeoyl-CoA O-methyltransferase